MSIRRRHLPTSAVNLSDLIAHLLSAVRQESRCLDVLRIYSGINSETDREFSMNELKPERHALHVLLVQSREVGT